MNHEHRWQKFGGWFALGVVVAVGCSDSHELIGGDEPSNGARGGGNGSGGSKGGSKGGGGTQGGSGGSQGGSGQDGGEAGVAGDSSVGGTGGRGGMGGMAGGGKGGTAGSGGSGVPANCGDDVLDPGEECDDGNDEDGDGCSSICTAACEACEATFCGDSNPDGSYVDLCFNGPGETMGGPAPGVSKALLCTQLVACVRRSNCARNAFIDCYCGTFSGMDCVGGMANGACKAEIERAAESTSPAEVAGFNLGRTDFASGRASVLIQDCDRMYCSNQCFGTTGGGGMGGAGGTGGGGSGGSAGGSGGSGIGGAGSGGAGMGGMSGSAGMAGSGGGGFTDPSTMECIGCELGDNPDMDEICAPLVGACASILGMSPTNRPRSELCWEALTCARETNCAAGATAASECYCGTSGGACLSPGQANGVCKAEFERAFETTDPLLINSRSADTNYAGGVVFQRLNCDSVICPDDCF